MGRLSSGLRTRPYQYDSTVGDFSLTPEERKAITDRRILANRTGTPKHGASMVNTWFEKQQKFENMRKIDNSKFDFDAGTKLFIDPVREAKIQELSEESKLNSNFGTF